MSTLFVRVCRTSVVLKSVNRNVLHSYRLFNSSSVWSHDACGTDHKTKVPDVVINKSSPKKNDKVPLPKDKVEEEDDDDMEEMFVQGPSGMEWGGPTRGGRRPEPTRFGDWERKGRATDFK